MYRIELGPEDVGVFRSVEEMATAIRSGVITPRARIYHQASDKWLPIEFHPHYRKALELASSAGPHSGPVTPIPTAGLTHAAAGAPMPPRAAPAPLAASTPAPASFQPPSGEASPGHAAPAQESPHESTPYPVAADARSAQPAPNDASRSPSIHSPADSPAAHVQAAHAPPADPISEPARPRWTTFEPLPRAAATGPAIPGASGPVLTAAATSGVAMADEEELELERPVLMTAEAAPEPFMPELEGPHPVAHRPRIRIALSGTGARRPFRWALGGVVLAATTHIGLQAAPNLHLAGELPLPHVAATLESSRQARDGTGPAEPAPRAPEPQGSPSFGSSSAFATTTAGTSSPHHAPAAPLAMANPTSTGAPAPAPADSAPVIAPKPAIAIAGAVPPIGPTADNRTPAGLVSRYQSAYADARTELETGLRTAGFANLFDPERLGTVEGVKEARRSVGTATAYVAKYRRREAEIEAAYGDSAAALAKEYGWTEQQQKAWSRRKVLQESPQVAKLASFLLQSLDSLYGVLSAQEGAYELRLGTLTFRDPKAAQAYAELRPWLDPKVHAWADSSASAAGPSSAVRVLRAMGPAKLPESGGF